MRMVACELGGRGTARCRRGPVGRIPKALSPADRMRRRLRITRGHAIYAQRKMTVDPVVGQIKGRGVRRGARTG